MSVLTADELISAMNKELKDLDGFAVYIRDIFKRSYAFPAPAGPLTLDNMTVWLDCYPENTDPSTIGRLLWNHEESSCENPLVVVQHDGMVADKNWLMPGVTRVRMSRLPRLSDLYTARIHMLHDGHKHVLR